MKENQKRKVLFVCDTGGHYSQMMVLKDLFSEYDSRLLTVSSTKTSNDIPVKYIKLNCNRNHRKADFLFTFIQCFLVWISFRPSVIISTGGGLAIPIFFWGKLFGSKLIYIETRARVYTKSITGKILYPLCNKIIVQWPEMQQLYKNAEYWGTLV
jgi:UDP-N-acetylglucosamine:LPS N-acetylglucosamine transferase